MSLPKAAFPEPKALPVEYLPGSPASLYNAPVGQLVVDTVRGNLWIKTTPALSNTGWILIGGGSFPASPGVFVGTGFPPAPGTTPGAVVGDRYYDKSTGIWSTFDPGFGGWF